MGHAHEELIIKIKYRGELASPLLFEVGLDDEVGRDATRRDADGGGGGGGGSRALVFPSPAGGNIHN